MPTDPFLDRLAALCGEAPTAPKWVLVPTHALGHTLGDRLALQRVSWVNLRFKTPFDLALETAAPFLVERGLDPVGDDVGPTLVMRLLLDLPDATPRYFRSLDGQTVQEKMAAAVWATLRELRLAGLGPDDLPPAAFADADKHTELVALIRAYEGYLANRRVADAADVFTEALDHLGECPVGQDDHRLALPGVVWAPLIGRFVAALPGRDVGAGGALHLPVPGLTVPAGLTAERGEPAVDARETGPDAAGTDAAALRFLMKPELASPPRGDGTLTSFRAGGREAEAEEVFRRIAEADWALDTVEIACASSDHQFLTWQKALRYDWPVTLSAGIPLAATRPARALQVLFDWIEHDYPASRLRRLLQSGDVKLDREDGLTAGGAARLLARSDAAWGRSTYDAALKGLAAAERERAAAAEQADEGAARALERAQQADGLRLWIEHLLTLVPVSDANQCVPFDTFARGVGRFVADYTRRPSPLDNAGAAAIDDALEELRLLDDLRLPLREALRLVRSVLEEVTVGADRARPGHLHVTMLARAGHAGRPHTFVVGLEEGRVFPADVEDAVLLDRERQAIGGGLPTLAERATDAVYRVVSRLAALGAGCDPAGSVCLSYSCRDLRQYRGSFPSWLLLQAHRLGRTDERTYQDLIQALGEPVSAVPPSPDAALGDDAWWLAHLRAPAGLSESPVLAAFPALRRGHRAASARASDLFTPYDGYVPDAGPLLDPRTSGRVVSATRLEQLAACPFRHFLRSGLGVDALEEQEPSRDVWLDPLTRGSELHALYADVMRRVRAQGRGLDPQDDHAWLVERADERLRRLSDVMPPPSAIVFERERRQLIDDLDLFVRFEAERAGSTPVALEVGFGRPGRDLLTDAADAAEPLARAEPIAIGDGPASFLLRGKIDRIDRADDGTYHVVDYKTGGFFRDNYQGTFRAGRPSRRSNPSVERRATVEWKIATPAGR